MTIEKQIEKQVKQALSRLTPEQKKQRAEERKRARMAAKIAAEIQAEKDQKPVKEIIFTIEWKHSRTWGANPALTCAVRFQDGSYEESPIYRASWCGYDKTSTVVAEAFNTYLKYKLWQKTPAQLIRKDHNWQKENGAPYGIRHYEADPAGRHGEGRSYEGGIGISCYPAIGQYIGGKFETVSTGKSFDVFKYTDGQ